MHRTNNIEDLNRQLIKNNSTGFKNYGTNNLKEAQLNEGMVQKIKDYFRWNDYATSLDTVRQIEKTNQFCRTEDALGLSEQERIDILEQRKKKLKDEIK